MTTTTTTTTTTKRDPFDLLGLALLEFGSGFLFGIAVTARWLVLFPMLSLPVLLAVTVGSRVHPFAGLGVVAVHVTGLIVWRVKYPASFHRWITDRARARFLAWFRYGRRWVPLLTACGLVVTDGDRVRVPRLREVWIGDSDDLVHVRMVAGHRPDDYSDRAEQLAHAFGAEECRIRVLGPGLVELNFRYHDALAEPMNLPQIIDGADWTKDAA
ncbi:hypothetical protein IU449_00105 [Nocardia higoensis]|uniref:Uncharacterized protein n=1 Tax=Nocardia higoensis TaxID=228599 RepID=A0ABS0D865_9NOCA|nr:hypothetical protein [Nocardia higoensis]MBF6352963.1 hypothetical protein [Nocardia higoensis]